MINILHLINHSVAVDESVCSQHENVPHKSQFPTFFVVEMKPFNNK